MVNIQWMIQTHELRVLLIYENPLDYLIYQHLSLIIWNDNIVFIILSTASTHLLFIQKYKVN